MAIVSRFAAMVAYALASSMVFAETPPNIVLIYADDLGYGDVSCNGATQITTPQIDRLAKDGLRFTDGHSTSGTCTPSRYSMMTGEYAWRKKGTGILPGNANLIIKPGRTTMASVLKQAGYTTGAIGKWHLGLGAGEIDWNGEIKPGPLEIGFDYCFLIPATGDRVPCVYVENHQVAGLEANDLIKVSYKEPILDEPTGKDHPELLRMHPSHGHDQTIINGISRIGYMRGGHTARWVDEDIAETLTRKAVGFIEQNQAKPFFLYFATHDIHVPRVPHPRFAGKSGMGPRGDAILEFDACVGELLDTLDRLDLAAKTLVILTSDNGPVVDDGYKDDAVEKLGSHRPNAPWRGGKGSKFEAGTRVPFVVRWPGRVKPGTSDALVCQIDFVASFAALVGQQITKDDAPDTTNVLPALLGESKTGRDHLVEQGGQLSLRQGDWKYIPPSPGEKITMTRVETGNDPQPQLYNVAVDRGETDNLAPGNPDKVAQMRARLAQITGTAPHQ